jgi:hypothetical protein
MQVQKHCKYLHTFRLAPYRVKIYYRYVISLVQACFEHTQHKTVREVAVWVRGNSW